MVAHLLDAAVAAFAAQAPWWSVAWAHVALPVGVVVVCVLLLVHRPSGANWLGPSLVQRALLASGVAVLFAVQGGPSEIAGAAVAAFLLVGASVAEPLLRRAVTFKVPVAAHLPGLDVPPVGKAVPPWAVLAASLTALTAGVVLGIMGASAWWWALIAAASGVAPAMAVWHGRQKVLAARQVRAQLPRALARYAPEFLVYTARPDDASYQVTMWLPYLKRSGKRFVIVTRNHEPARALAALTDVPVIEARQIEDLDRLIVPSLAAAYYVNASSGNGNLVRFQHLTHVYLGHGDSDKPPSYNPTHAMYDRIFAAGPAATRRYAAHGVWIPAEKFQVVGRPQVEAVQPARRPIAEVEHPVVLYAPTWRGHVEETMLYSLPQGEKIVSALLARGATVIFRPHPFSYDFPEDRSAAQRIQALLAKDAAATGRAHLWGRAAETERGILDCINASDAMVSDVSSVVSDYLFSGKPFAMVSVPTDPERFVVEYPLAAASYVVRADLANLDEALNHLLGDDPLAARRRVTRVDYLGDFPAEGYAEVFVQAVRDTTAKAEPTVEEEPPNGEGEALADQEADSDPEAEALESADEADAAEEVGRPTPVVSVRTRRMRQLRTLWRLTNRVVHDLVGVVAALLALLAGILPITPLVPHLLAWAAVASFVIAGWSLLRRPERWRRLLNRSGPTRAVLLVALSATAATAGAWPAHVAIAVSALAVALAGERPITTAWSQVGLEVRSFPAVNAETREPISRGVLPIASLAVTAVGFLLITIEAPMWIFSGAAAVVFAIFLEALIRSQVRAIRTLTGEDRLIPALIEHAPQFAVYFASTVGAAYQIGMWLPYFVRIGRPWIIVTRSLDMHREIGATAAAAGVDVPIIHRPTLRSVEDVVVPSLQAAFYVNNAVRNTHFVERREITHVWLNHGDSEKPACYNPVHAIYDLIFSAGQAGIDRYARHGVNIPREKFRIVGRPQVEVIKPARGPIREQQPPTVLYAPTWQGPYADSRLFSLPIGREIVEHLLARGARVIFRAHPFNYRYGACVRMIRAIGALLDADRERTGLEHLWGPAAEKAMSIEDCFNLSDAMVADVSAVVSDYLQSQKPFAIVSIGRTPEQLLLEAPAARAAYVLEQDLSNIDEVCDELLVTDSLREVRDQTRVYYLGDFPAENYAEGFLTAARDVIDARQPVAHSAS
jgi:CDP-glycerol glycerophosphotransferase (TagB/SpsB family)